MFARTPVQTEKNGDQITNPTGDGQTEGHNPVEQDEALKTQQNLGAINNTVTKQSDLNTNTQTGDQNFPKEWDEEALENPEELNRQAKYYKTLVTKTCTKLNKNYKWEANTENEMLQIDSDFDTVAFRMTKLWNKQIKLIKDQKKRVEEGNKLREKSMEIQRCRNRISGWITKLELQNTLGTYKCLLCREDHQGKCKPKHFSSTPYSPPITGWSEKEGWKELSRPGLQKNLGESPKLTGPPTQEQDKLMFAGYPLSLHESSQIMEQQQDEINKLKDDLNRLKVLGPAGLPRAQEVTTSQRPNIQNQHTHLYRDSNL